MTFLDAIKHVVMRYTGFIWAILKPMGPWGVFVIAGLCERRKWAKDYGAPLRRATRFHPE